MQAVKYALLSLLTDEPRHGYDLKGAFEELLGGSWPLNVGQVYTTLARLERDGLVRSEVVPQDLVPDRKVYEITPAGREELDAWIDEPSEGPVRLRDELYVKVLIQNVIKGGDAWRVIARQRQRHLQTLAELSAVLEDGELPTAARLIVEGAMLHVEADLQWLDLCEEQLTKPKGRTR
jgi:DNA-binding PadR family transcriptional regulator